MYVGVHTYIHKLLYTKLFVCLLYSTPAASIAMRTRSEPAFSEQHTWSGPVAHHRTVPPHPVPTGRLPPGRTRPLERDDMGGHKPADVPGSLGLVHSGGASLGEGGEGMDISDGQSELLDGRDSVQVQRVLDFLRSTTHQDPEYLKHLFSKCNYDLDRTIDVALTLTMDETSDYGSEDRQSDTEGDGCAASESHHEPSKSVTQDNKSAAEVSDDSNLVLKLSISLAAQLQQLFGEIDKTLFTDGMHVCLFMHWRNYMYVCLKSSRWLGPCCS